MFGVDKKYLSISIHESVIKAAQVASSGAVEKVARASADAASPEEAGKTLKNLLAGFDRGAGVICVVPSNAATAKNIEVPSTDPEEIKSIINLQASRHTPYSREEVLIGYINLGLSASNNTRILLVITHRNVVKEKIAILEKAGLEPDKVLFAPEAMARFYIKALGLKKDALPCGIIDFSLNATNYIVTGRGSLLFTRHIPIGLKALVEDPDTVHKLQEELKKSVDSFVQEDGNEPPASYAVTTGHEAVQQLLPALGEALGMQCQVSEMANFVKASGAIKKKLRSDFGDDSFLDVIATGQAAAKSEVNLMPEEMVLKKTVERQSREATKAGVAAVLIMLLIGGMIMTDIYFKYTYLNKNLREHFAPQKQQVKELEQRMSKFRVVRDYLQGRMVSLDMLHELNAITPNTVYLNNVSMDPDGNVTIDGISESMSQVFSYVKALDDSPVFKDAKTKSTSTKKQNGKDVAVFEIGFSMDNSKESM